MHEAIVRRSIRRAGAQSGVISSDAPSFRNAAENTCFPHALIVVARSCESVRYDRRLWRVFRTRLEGRSRRRNASAQLPVRRCARARRLELHLAAHAETRAGASAMLACDSRRLRIGDGECAVDPDHPKPKWSCREEESRSADTAKFQQKRPDAVAPANSHGDSMAFFRSRHGRFGD